MNDVIYWLWLSTSPRIGPRAITSLLKYYGSPKEMYFAPVGEITRPAAAQYRRCGGA